jgi:hypothetical protein
MEGLVRLQRSVGNRTYLYSTEGEKIWEISKIKNGGTSLKGLVLMSSPHPRPTQAHAVILARQEK